MGMSAIRLVKLSRTYAGPSSAAGPILRGRGGGGLSASPALPGAALGTGVAAQPAMTQIAVQATSRPTTNHPCNRRISSSRKVGDGKVHDPIRTDHAS